VRPNGVDKVRGGIYVTSKFGPIISKYFTDSQNNISKISISDVSRLVNALQGIQLSGKTVFIAGNGGSASTSSHFATDIGVGSLRWNSPIRAISLCDNVAVITALSNDFDYDLIFADQLRVLAKPGDLLIVISASGNSKNLIEAIKVGKELGLEAYSMTGFDGGELRVLTRGRNIHLDTPKGSYGLVEDTHLSICHVITECLRSIEL
jgi:D-sedoheptulose 7-phosphate isomerase